MNALATRAFGPEQMDDPGLDPETLALVLRQLGTVNRWTLAARPTLNFLSIAVGIRIRFRLLDVGSGDGWMLRTIARWAASHGIDAELVGIDINPRSAAVARAASPGERAITYLTGDYRDLDEPFDIITSNLVAHHMRAGELRDFIVYMENRSSRGWMINDLHRHPLPHAAFPLLARAAGWHPMIAADGQLSIARSFRRFEWRDILVDAGIDPDAVNNGRLKIARRFPWRLCVERLH